MAVRAAGRGIADCAGLRVRQRLSRYRQRSGNGDLYPFAAAGGGGATDTEPGVRVAAGFFAGAILLAAVDAGVIAGVLPLPAAGVPLNIPVEGSKATWKAPGIKSSTSLRMT